MTPGAVEEEVTVAIPTIGRTTMLGHCLDSLRTGSRLPSEVLLFDQSDGSEVLELAAAEPVLNVRVERCPGRGIARNMNLALHSSRTDALLVTHDDSEVAGDWVEVGLRKLAEHPGGIVTSRVKGGGDPPELALSTIDRWDARDFTGTSTHGALYPYPNNMGLHCREAVAMGGFDERPGFATAAEDLDFSYRWPYRTYARSAGHFYGKHLAQRDRSIVGLVLSDLRLGIRARLGRLRRRTPRWTDERLELPFWMPIGLVEGLSHELRPSLTDVPRWGGRSRTASRLCVGPRMSFVDVGWLAITTRGLGSAICCSTTGLGLTSRVPQSNWLGREDLANRAEGAGSSSETSPRPAHGVTASTTSSSSARFSTCVSHLHCSSTRWLRPRRKTQR